MSESTPVYSIGTYDMELEAYTPQEGLSVPCINVPLATMRQVLRELRGIGYDAHRIRGADGNYDCNDSSVLVERTDGMSEAEVLASWDRKQWIVRYLEEAEKAKEGQ